MRAQRPRGPHTHAQVPNRRYSTPQPPPWHADLAPTPPSADTPLLASLPQGLMLMRRRHRAPSGPLREGCGRPGVPVTALNSRRARVVCAGDGASARTSAGGVRGARWAPAAACAAGAERPRRSSHAPRLPRLAVGARLQPRGAGSGSEAAPGRLARARRWPRVMPRPTGAVGALVRSCHGRLRVSCVVHGILRFCRDCISVSAYNDELCSRWYASWS